jgi:uncharacterized protein YjbI with pentapeptide repeats|tara:strand:- start:253 stop:540 length:288 start_codon:yes stop_codon:yes gene_type:complete
MKTLMILSMAMALLASPSWGYKQEDLDKLAAINTCQECDLAGADLHLAYLREANLRGAVLIGAVLRDAKIDFADFTKAKFCNTVMPDGQRIFKDC